MHYLALGDSISIDDYTNVAGGGAASQFAYKIGATPFQDLTQDGQTTEGVLMSLGHIQGLPDVVTLTAGGNDFLAGASAILQKFRARGWGLMAQETVHRLHHIVDHLQRFDCPIILNTVYDPTDGDDSLLATFGLSHPAPARAAFNAINDGIRELARRPGFLLADLERQFHGHGVVAEDTWLVMQIEPNFAGATAIAEEWHRLYQQATEG